MTKLLLDSDWRKMVDDILADRTKLLQVYDIIAGLMKKRRITDEDLIWYDEMTTENELTWFLNDPEDYPLEGYELQRALKIKEFVAHLLTRPGDMEWRVSDSVYAPCICGATHIGFVASREHEIQFHGRYCNHVEPLQFVLEMVVNDVDICEETLPLLDYEIAGLVRQLEEMHMLVVDDEMNVILTEVGRLALADPNNFDFERLAPVNRFVIAENNSHFDAELQAAFGTADIVLRPDNEDPWLTWVYIKNNRLEEAMELFYNYGFGLEAEDDMNAFSDRDGVTMLYVHTAVEAAFFANDPYVTYAKRIFRYNWHGDEVHGIVDCRDVEVKRPWRHADVKFRLVVESSLAPIILHVDPNDVKPLDSFVIASKDQYIVVRADAFESSTVSFGYCDFRTQFGIHRMGSFGTWWFHGLNKEMLLKGLVVPNGHIIEDPKKRFMEEGSILESALWQEEFIDLMNDVCPEHVWVSIHQGNGAYIVQAQDIGTDSISRLTAPTFEQATIGVTSVVLDVLAQIGYKAGDEVYIEHRKHGMFYDVEFMINLLSQLEKVGRLDLFWPRLEEVAG